MVVIGLLIFQVWSLNNRIKLLEAQLSAAHATMKQAGDARPLDQVPAATFYVPPPNSAKGIIKVQEATAEDFRNEDAMLRSKTLQYTQLKVRQRGIQKKYAYLFEGLEGVNADTLKRLKELLVDRDLAINETRASAARLGYRPDSDAYQQALAETTRESEQNIQALLGDKYGEFMTLDGLSGSMQLLDNAIGPDMAFGDAPLSSTQRLALAGIMQDLHYAMDDKQFTALVQQSVDPNTGLNPLNSQLVEKAAAILSPVQLEILKAYQKEQTAFQEYRTKGP